MSRDMNLPLEALEQALVGLERDARELSTTAQRTGGASLLFKATEGAAGYDWSGLLTPDSFGSGVKLLRVIATASTADNLYGDLITWPLYVDGAPYRLADQFDALAAGDPAFFMETYEDQVSPDQPREKRWIVALNGDHTTPVGLKVCVIANDIVAVTVEELN